jgi:hypothetical protein
MKCFPFLGALLVLLACQPQDVSIGTSILSFEDCVAAGNAVMESYPRQCQANGQNFIEEIEEPAKEAPVYILCSEDEQQNQACTKEYLPVCGFADNGVRCITAPCSSTNAHTFGNSCEACAAQSYGYYEGALPR